MRARPGGRVVDETGERVADVRVVDGVIAEVGAGARRRRPGATVLDAEGCVVAPGLVDIQVHFREPGREDSETIETGARAAALGGCTAVVCMPNTDPPLDDAAVVQSVLERGRDAVVRRARRRAASRRAGAGEELAPMGELYDLGVRVFTDDGDCVADARVMRGAFEYVGALPGAVLAQHAEDPALVRGGHMHEGAWSARLGIPGRPAEAESSIVARDLALAQAHRRPLPRAAPLERGRRPSSCAPRRPTACASPRSARRSTSCSPTRRARTSTRCSR